MRVKEGVYPSEDFSIVTSQDELCDLTTMRGFLENPLDKNEWEQKTKTGIIRFDAESLKSLLEKLTKHDLLLVTGPQQVGKSTLLLCFVDECLRGTIGPWKVIVFLNPYLTAEDLKVVLVEAETELQRGLRNYASRQILIAVDGLKRTGENDEEYASKCLVLFEWVLRREYKLIASLRDDQKRTLEKTLRDKERHRLDKWKKLDLDEEPLEPNDQFEDVRRMLVNYLTWDRYKRNIKISLSFDDPEFNECVKLVAKKSDGLIGYIVFLVDDISASSHEFTMKTVERYPEGMTKLVWNTINRDYFVRGDKALPLLLTFLAKQEYPVTEQFVRSLTEWGVNELDADASISRKEIMDKMENLLLFHTKHVVSKVGRIDILQYLLKNQVREAIEDGLLNLHDAPDLGEARKALSDVGGHFESLVTVTYFHRLQEDLAQRKMSPKYYVTWCIFADIAKLWGVRSLSVEARVHALEHALDFFVNNVRKEVQRTKEWDYFEIALSWMLRNAVDAIPIEDCALAIKFYKSINLDPNDSWSRWVVGQLHERKNEDGEALKWYVESKRVENTSRGYGSLIKKLGSMLERSPEDIWIEYLDLNKAAAIKAIECYAGEHRNWTDLARVLMNIGDIFYRRGELRNAIESFDRAALACEKAMEVNEILPHSYERTKRRDQTKLAIILGYKARAEFYNGRLEEAIVDKKRAIETIKSAKTEIDTTNDEMWLSRYNSRLHIRRLMTTLLESILNLADLHAKGEKRTRLSDEWYSIKLMLDEIEQKVTRGNLKDLKVSALYHSLMLDETNEIVQHAMAEIEGTDFREIGETQCTSKYHENRAESIDQEQIVDALLERIFAALIQTKDFFYHLRRGDIHNEKDQRYGLSSKWSEIGWRISSDLLSIVPRELAARFFELSILFRDDSAASWYNLGWEYLQERKADSALKALIKSMELEKDQGQKRYSHLSRIGIGKIHKEKGNFVFALKNFKEASNLLKELGKTDPREAASLLIETAENLKDLASCATETDTRTEILKEALKTYNRSLEISQEAQLTTLLGTLFRKISWSENWIQWSEEETMPPLTSLSTLLKTSLVSLLHLETDPERIETLYQRASAFYRMKEYEKANEYEDKILRMDPTNILAYINKATGLRRLGKYDEASECGDKALEINDKDARALYAKGGILLMQSVRENDKTAKHNRIVKAIEWFDSSLRSDPYYAPAWAWKGNALQDLGGTDNEEEAAKCFTSALELEPRNLGNWTDLIHLTFRLSMQKRKTEEPDFKAFGELVDEALHKVDECDKSALVARARKSVIHCFKEAILENYIISREKLIELANKFKKSNQLIEAPSLDEIEKSCRRDKDFAKNTEKVKKIFGS